MKSLFYLSLLFTSCTCITACKESKPLPPTSTPAELKISNYPNWNFGENAYQHTKKICSFGPRPIESKAHKNTQDYITSTLEKSNWVVKPQGFQATTPYGKRNFTNLIARYNIGGDTKKTNSPTILLSAHFDSKMLRGFLGADDAASCVGALLEIAEKLPKADPNLAQQIEIVFFDGEEALKKNIILNKDGLYGSLYYSSYLNKDLGASQTNYQKRPSFGILLDMIGHKNLQVAIPSDTPYKLLKSYLKITEKHKITNQFKVYRQPIIDDHLYMNEIAKVPTMDLIGDFTTSKWWHTRNDDFSLISKQSLSTSIQVTLEIINDQVK